MTTTTAFTRDSLVAVVDEVSGSLRALTIERRSQNLTGDDVRDAIMDICIGLEVTKNNLPERLQRMLQQATVKSPDDQFRAAIIIEGLNMSITDTFGPLVESTLDDAETGALQE